MAQTKRKRRSKHRGNAAGTIEVRGRTGRKPTGAEARKGARESARDRRLRKPPTWNGALMKAGFMALALFALGQLTTVFGKNTSLAQSATLAVFAMLLYTPLAYYTDRWVYQRTLRQAAKAGKGS
jgi:hypothetical protein